MSRYFKTLIISTLCLLLAACADLSYDALGSGYTSTFIKLAEYLNAEELTNYRRGGESLLSLAVRRYDARAVKYLLERGVPPDTGDASPYSDHPSVNTPLRIAAYYGYTDIGAILLDAGANIDAEAPRNRKTPLITAAWKCRLDFVEMLIRRGANQQARDSNGHDYRFYLNFCH